MLPARSQDHDAFLRPLAQPKPVAGYSLLSFLGIQRLDLFQQLLWEIDLEVWRAFAFQQRVIAFHS